MLRKRITILLICILCIVASFIIGLYLHVLLCDVWRLSWLPWGICQ